MIPMTNNSGSRMRGNKSMVSIIRSTKVLVALIVVR